MLNRRNDSTASSLLPLFIILGVFAALAVAWFALSSCMGDDLRHAIAQRLQGLVDRVRGRSSPSTAGQYGRMRDDPEATAFDINMDDMYDADDQHYQHRPYPTR